MISFDSFRCPVCRAKMEITNDFKSVICKGEAKAHCFDFSKSGYVNFAPPSQSGSGDSKEAVRSRTVFLESDGYLPVCNKIVSFVNKYCHGGLVIDAGCGEGYYTNKIAKAYSGDVIGFDLSKFGADNGAKRARQDKIENSFFAVGSVFSLPVADSVADGIVNIFAPCVEEEYNRVLKDGGVLIIAGAGEDHLIGLKSALYEEIYKNTEREDMPKGLKLVEEAVVEYDLSLSESSMIMALFSMTPYYYRTSESDVKKLEALNELNTKIQVKIKVYKK